MPKISLFKILKIKRIAVYAYVTLIGFMTSCTQNTDIESVREVQLSLNTDLLQEDDVVLYLLRQNYLEQPELIDSLNTTSNKSISLSVNSQDLLINLNSLILSKTTTVSLSEYPITVNTAAMKA